MTVMGPINHKPKAGALNTLLLLYILSHLQL